MKVQSDPFCISAYGYQTSCFGIYHYSYCITEIEQHLDKCKQELMIPLLHKPRTKNLSIQFESIRIYAQHIHFWIF